jgi:hypothetical protein
MDNKTKILIIFPPVLIIIFIFIATSVPFEEKLSGAEKQTLEFIPSDIRIKEREIIHVTGELKIPMGLNISGVTGDFLLSPAEDDLVSQIGYNDNTLSLIVISGKSRMAIIKGVVVKEGDNIGGIKVVKIEPQRVLLRNKTTKWLYMEKTK